MPALRLLALLACLVTGGAAFVVPAAHAAAPTLNRAASSAVSMGNNAPDGPFTPAVRLGKVVLGEKLLNKVRGKAISYHSQFITEFCQDFGVSTKMRGGLIKKAKKTGGLLGFLS
jgi:hypothetical protein